MRSFSRAYALIIRQLLNVLGFLSLSSLTKFIDKPIEIYILLHGTILCNNICHSLLTEEIGLYSVEEHGDAVLSLQILLDQDAQVRGELCFQQLHTFLAHVEEEEIVRGFCILTRQLVATLFCTVNPPTEELITRLTVFLGRRFEGLLQARYLYFVRLFKFCNFC